MDFTVFLEWRWRVQSAILHLDASLRAALLAYLRLVILEAEEKGHVVGGNGLLASTTRPLMHHRVGLHNAHIADARWVGYRLCSFLRLLLCLLGLGLDLRQGRFLQLLLRWLRYYLGN